MPAATPISETLIHVSRAAVEAEAPVKAAIDRGCSLSKFVYITKDSDPSNAFYTFRCALFRNEDFEGGLYFLKEKALLPYAGKVRVTGVGWDLHKELVLQVLGLEIEFIDEFGSNIRGLRFLLSHALSPEDLFCPKIELQLRDTGKTERPAVLQAMVKKVEERMKANNGPDPNARFPCLFVLLGSTYVCYLITPDGKGRLLGINLNGGKTLLGLGKALVGTGSYDDLMQLAERGCASNVSLAIGDFFREDSSSEYAGFPPHLFAFGKLISSKLPLEHYDPEDRAAALVHMVSMSIHALALSSAKAASVTRVFIGGNAVRAEILRQSIIKQEYVRGKILDVNFLKTAHTGAFGAMTTTESEARSIQF